MPPGPNIEPPLPYKNPTIPSRPHVHPCNEDFGQWQSVGRRGLSAPRGRTVILPPPKSWDAPCPLITSVFAALLPDCCPWRSVRPFRPPRYTVTALTGLLDDDVDSVWIGSRRYWWLWWWCWFVAGCSISTSEIYLCSSSAAVTSCAALLFSSKLYRPNNTLIRRMPFIYCQQACLRRFTVIANSYWTLLDLYLFLKKFIRTV